MESSGDGYAWAKNSQKDANISPTCHIATIGGQGDKTKAVVGFPFLLGIGNLISPSVMAKERAEIPLASVGRMIISLTGVRHCFVNVM